MRLILIVCLVLAQSVIWIRPAFGQFVNPFFEAYLKASLEASQCIWTLGGGWGGGSSASTRLTEEDFDKLKLLRERWFERQQTKLVRPRQIVLKKPDEELVEGYRVRYLLGFGAEGAVYQTENEAGKIRIFKQFFDRRGLREISNELLIPISVFESSVAYKGLFDDFGDSIDYELKEKVLARYKQSGAGYYSDAYGINVETGRIVRYD